MEFSRQLRTLKEDHPRQVYNWLKKVCGALKLEPSDKCTEHDLNIIVSYHLHYANQKDANNVKDKVHSNYKAVKVMLKDPVRGQAMLQGDIKGILKILNTTQKENEMKNEIKKAEAKKVEESTTKTKGVSKMAEKTATAKADTKVSTKVKAEKKEKSEGINGRKFIIDLLLERKLSDEKIFEKYLAYDKDSARTLSAVASLRAKLNAGKLAPKYPVPKPLLVEIGGTPSKTQDSSKTKKPVVSPKKPDVASKVVQKPQKAVVKPVPTVKKAEPVAPAVKKLVKPATPAPVAVK